MSAITSDEELEAVIWQAMQAHGVTAPRPVVFVEHLRHLARAYAAGDCAEVAAARRDMLDLTVYAHEVDAERRAVHRSGVRGRRVKTIGIVETGRVSVVVWDDTRERR